MSGFQAAAVSGSVMILVIALLRLTAGKRLPRALFPALWCAAAFRLLLPVRLPSAHRSFRRQSLRRICASSWVRIIRSASRSASRSAGSRTTGRRTP